MAADDVFPAEMPDRAIHPIPPLDDGTAERLLAGRLDPDDAPPFYADVARLLRAAAGPAVPDELGGEETALAQFRAARVGSTGVAGRGWTGGRGGAWRRSRRAGVGERSGRVRGRALGRLVAVALAGVLVVGGAVAGGATGGGLWTAVGVPSSGRLRSPTGGPGADPAGSGAVTGRERAVARHGGGGGSRGGGTAHGAKPLRTSEANPGNAGKAKAPKPGKPKAGKPKAGKPKAQKPAPKGPKATPGQVANHAGGRRN
jgi:hypothetical protein